MALFDIKTQTTVGRNYLTQAVGGSKIIWDNVKVSTDYFSNPVGLTDLTNVIISSPIDYAKQVSNEQFDIGGHVDSSGIHADTVIKTWGLYGHIGTDNSQLLAVLSSQSGQTLYANTTDIQTIKETFSLVFPNPSNAPISYTVSNSGFALDNNVVHLSGNETADGVKNFQDGLQSGGKNVVTQNGDDTINVTNGSTNSAIEPVDKSKIKDAIIQTSLSSTDNIDNLQNDGRYPFDSVVISGIDPNDKISGYLDQSTNGSTVIQKTVYTVSDNKYLKIRSKANGTWSNWITLANVQDLSNGLNTKVNVADMRKPASDVAGIDETVHDNHDNTITANGTSYDLSKSGLTPLGLVNSGSFNDLPLGTVFVGNIKDGPDNIHSFTVTTFYYSQWKGRKAQIAVADSTNLMFYRIYNADAWSNWTKLADDSTVVHATDMRKPASDVAGIEEVNAKQDKIGYTPADDSKVVHSTDTSNWQKLKITTDTGTPTLGLNVANNDDLNTTLDSISAGIYTIYCQIGVKNNPSPNSVRGLFHKTDSNFGVGYLVDWFDNMWSVYIDKNNGTHDYIKVADDSKVAHLSGANNFDTVPTVNNNPLLLASSLPSDLARTGQSQTFTQPQTFSIAPTITDASKDKGDNQAATMADLKSVENSAWHFLKTKDVGGDFDINMLYFKDYKSDYIRIIFLADSNVRSKTYSNYRIIVDMSKVITSFSDSSQIIANLSLGEYMTGNINRTEQGTANFVIATISGTLGQYQSVMAATDFSSTGSLGEFRGIDFKVNGFI